MALGDWTADGFRNTLNQSSAQHHRDLLERLGGGAPPAPPAPEPTKSVKRKGLQYLKGILSRWSYQRYRLQGKLVVRGHQSGNIYSLRNDTLKTYIPVPGGTLVIDICVQAEAAKSDRISVLYDYLRFKESEIWKVGNITNTKLKAAKK